MSVEYENEFDRFADDVKYRLEQEGILNQIKAELRAAVYKAVVSDGQTWKPEQKTEALKLAEASPLGQLAADLVIDYLDHLHLRQTLCVLAPESGLFVDPEEGKHRIEAAFPHLSHQGERKPLLLQLLEQGTSTVSSRDDHRESGEASKSESVLHFDNVLAIQPDDDDDDDDDEYDESEDNSEDSRDWGVGKREEVFYEQGFLQEGKEERGGVVDRVDVVDVVDHIDAVTGSIATSESSHATEDTYDDETYEDGFEEESFEEDQGEHDQEEDQEEENSILSSLGEESFEENQLSSASSEEFLQRAGQEVDEQEDEQNQHDLYLSHPDQEEEEEDEEEDLIHPGGQEEENLSTHSSVLRTSLFSDSGSYDFTQPDGQNFQEPLPEEQGEHQYDQYDQYGDTSFQSPESTLLETEQPSFDQEQLGEEEEEEEEDHLQDHHQERDVSTGPSLHVQDETLEEGEFDALGLMDYQEDIGSMSGAIELEEEESLYGEEEEESQEEDGRNPFDQYDHVEEARLASHRQGSTSF